MVMNKVPSKKRKFNKTKNYKNPNPLDRINAILLGGMEDYKTIPINNFKYDKINTPLQNIIAILSKSKNKNKRRKIKKQKGGAYKLSNLILNQKEEEVEKKCKNPPGTENIKFIKTLEVYSGGEVQSPNDVIINLARFKSYNFGTILSKKNNVVTIDDTLNLYGKTYYLSAAIIHSGSLGSGHYWTLAKRGNNKWMKLDDKTFDIVDDETRKKEMNGTETGTNGVIFLYRKENNITIKYTNGTLNTGNGILNIGYSCYFNSILQFIITTDEYQDKNKMKKTRKTLYDFLTSVTEKSGANNFNDGTNLKNFGPDGKKGVKAFGLKEGCQEDAHLALVSVLNYDNFNYSFTAPVIYIKDKDFINEQYNKKASNITTQFTSNPPFFKYLFRETYVPKSSSVCSDKKIVNYLIETFMIKIGSLTITPNRNSSTRTTTPTRSTRSTRVSGAPTRTLTRETGPVNTDTDEDVENNEEHIPGVPDKPKLDKIDIYKGKEAEKYDHGTNVEKYTSLADEPLDRAEDQFKLMSKIITSDTLDSSSAIVGKDMVKELIRQEVDMKAMVNNMATNANTLKKQRDFLENNHAAAFARSQTAIQKQEKELKLKINEINILFKKLFHRRRKLSTVPTVWVN